MKLGRWTRTPATTLCLVAASLAFSGDALAQDAGKSLQEGVDLLKRGKVDEANKKFREVLASNPSSEDAYALVRATDSEIFLKMLAQGGESEQAAKRLLDLAHVAEVAKMRDPAAVDALVKLAIDGGDLGVRTKAANELAAKHGEYAAPALIERLGSTDTQTRANAVLALSRIGGSAVLPLVASLGAGNEMQRSNAARLLGRIGDHRAVPALLAAGGGKGQAAAAAADAAKALGGSGSAVDAYMKLAADYYGGDTQVLRNYDGTYVVWTAGDDGVSGRDVPGFMYRYELAEQCCYDALAIDGENAGARAMIALVACTELAAWENLSDEAQNSPAAAGAGAALDGARAVAASTGADDLMAAFAAGMEMGAGEALWYVGEAIAGVWGDAVPGAKSPLVAGLTHADKRIRYAAAVTLLQMDPGKPFPKSNLVATLAGQAAGEVAVPQVLVIDGDSKNAMNTQRALNAAGYYAVVADSGAGGLITAKATGAFDAVIVRSRLPDITPFQVFDDLNADVRTDKLVKIVMADGQSVGDAQAEFTARGVAGVAPTATDPAGIVNTLKEAMPPEGGDANQAAAAALSIAASNALAGTYGHAFDLKTAQAGLIGALRDTAPEAVRLAALGALAHMGTADAQGRLSELLADGNNSAALRVAAADALANAVRGQSPAKKTYDTLLEAMADGDVGVRTAAGRAMGSAKLSAAQQREVLQKRRVM